MSPDQATTVEVDGHRLRLSNLDKVLYPDAGFTKADVIHYYSQIAPVMLPHLRDRPVTLRRYPDGVDGPSFYEKNAPRGTPDWIRTVPVPRSEDGDGDIDYVLLDDPAALVWAANLAALELHVPMWRWRRPGEYGPVDLMVFDLDPGGPADLVDCCRVAAYVRETLAADGHDVFPKTSGSKGLQLYVPLKPARRWDKVRDQARRLARQMERDHPDEVLSNMRRQLRPGKVLIDWSQNHAAKNTVAVYSLRARARPTVSTPVTWDEVGACADTGDPGRLAFEAGDVLDRVADAGDLFAPVLDAIAS
ncbi:MAG TPA: non-homologous end-joining DNA ligase [Acidimicrobiales bacterium]|nr:non-homologous end-joining DNA ligase [Acidimicrobiales bacterium]